MVRIEQSKIDLANEDPNVFYVQMYDLPLTADGGGIRFLIL